MEQYPLFSILIANYNNGCYLQEAIESVLAQDYPNWEVIIVDDRSTDNSFEIYDAYKDDSHFTIVFNEENRGVGYTKNRCVENANGWICGFLDPDDVLCSKDALSIMIKAHKENPEASMVYSNMYQTDEYLNTLKEYPAVSIVEKSSALDTRSWPLHHFLSFKNELYQKTEGIDRQMRRAVDYDMYYKLEEVGSIVHVEEYLYKQRCSPHSLSLNANAYKAGVWHSYACVQAMKRRGLKDESLMLFPVEAALHREYVRGCEKILSSRIYRLGKALVSPVMYIRNLWRK